MKHNSPSLSRLAFRFCASRLWVFIAALGVVIIFSQSLRAQGLLPHPNEVASSTAGVHVPLWIGDRVPEGLFVLDGKGMQRTLLSYKAAIEVLSVIFVSPACGMTDKKWFELSRFYDDYKGWHVAFVAIDLGGVAGMEDLQKKSSKTGMDIPVVRDPPGRMVSLLRVTATPELMILDEDGYLRYRGPIGREARSAIQAVIGHLDKVKDPDVAIPDGCPVP